jgi:hypothetical protein
MKKDITTYVIVALCIGAASSVLTYYVHRFLDSKHGPVHNK